MAEHLTDNLGIYEEKWGVEKTTILEKVNGLDRYETAMIEIGALGFWETDPLDIDSYIDGNKNIATLKAGENISLEYAREEIKKAVEILEETKKAFKSPTVAKGVGILKKLI